MYVYFDVNGNLKEIVNLPVREGSVKANTIYIYIEPVNNPQPVNNIFSLPQRFTNAKINFRDDGGNNINPNGGNSVPMVKLTGDNAVQIPFDPKKDIYFFKYGFKYEMWSVELPSTVTSVNGLVSATAYLYNLSEQLPLNTFSFNVEASVGVKPDRTMSEAQYSYLYNKIQFVEEIEESFVPYTGADKRVDLGTQQFSSGAIGVYTNIEGTKTFIGGFSPSTGGVLYVETNTDLSGHCIVLEDENSYIGSKSDDNLIATHGWVEGLIGYNSENDFFDLGSNDLYIHGSNHFIEIGTSDYELRILQNRFIGHYDAVSTTLLLPLSQDEDVTETIATREWVNPSFAKTIEASADGTVPYRYNFTLKNGDGNVISTTYVDLEAEAIQADLEAYVDNAVGALKDDIEDGTVVAKKAENTDFTNADFNAYYLPDQPVPGMVELTQADKGFYYIYLDLETGTGKVNFGMVMVTGFTGYDNGLITYQKFDNDEYVLQVGFNGNTSPAPVRIAVFKNNNYLTDRGYLYIKKIR